MEAPNKLFIRPEKIKVEMIPGGELPNVGVQYIRKNLLLEWAKELTSEPYDRTTESARKHQIAHYLLEKYNSL